jgi:predicted DCC family thiol-disulfide oxidoreductase YuxK
MTPATTSATLNLIFDADCVLCSSAVRFVLAHERSATVCFVNAWSATGLAIAKTHGLSRADLDETFLVVRGSRAFVRSDAAFEVARELRAPWSWVRVFRIVPRPLRDALYTFTAKRRYRWFGQRPQCFRPLPDQAHRFVDDHPPASSR